MSNTTMLEALKKWLADRKGNYLDHQSWLGDTEGGFYSQDTFDFEKMLEEIDAFHEQFKK